jgi:hypothetical protein
VQQKDAKKRIQIIFNWLVYPQLQKRESNFTRGYGWENHLTFLYIFSKKARKKLFRINWVIEFLSPVRIQN